MIAPSGTSADVDTVLGKAVALLRAFGADDVELSLSALVERTGLPKTTVHRVANDLVAHRLLDRGELGYRLSGGLFELGLRASVERSLLELAMPFLQDLYERTHETVHLGVREGVEVVYITKIAGRRQAASPSRTGGRMPLHCTAIGKVLLAWAQDDVKQSVLTGPLTRRTAHTIVAPGILARQLNAALEEGVAYEREESALGILCVAAPILMAAGGPVAAISLTGPAGRFDPNLHVDALRAAAHGLSSIVAQRRSLLR